MNELFGVMRHSELKVFPPKADFVYLRIITLSLPTYLILLVFYTHTVIQNAKSTEENCP